MLGAPTQILTRLEKQNILIQIDAYKTLHVCCKTIYLVSYYDVIINIYI